MMKEQQPVSVCRRPDKRSARLTGADGTLLAAANKQAPNRNFNLGVSNILAKDPLRQ